MAKQVTAVLEQAIRTVSARVEETTLGDRELLLRFAEHDDQAAFAVLVRRYTGMVLGVCRRSLANVQDAEDACQATFLVLARKARAGRWRASVANWLYTTARRIASNARLAAERRLRRESRVALREAEYHAESMTGRELLAALQEELDRLHARYREPLVLCYLEGLTRDEVAARLDIPPGTIKTHLERGRKRLNEALTRRGCTLSAGLLALTVVSPARAASSRMVKAVLASVGGSPSSAAAELARGFIVNTFVQRLSRATLVAAAVAWLGIGAWFAWPVAEGQAPDKGQTARAEKPDAKPNSRAEEEGRRISGRVVDPDGKPVAKAVIVLTGMDADEKATVKELATTDADGGFRCVVPAQPKHKWDNRQLVARASGFAADWIAVAEASSTRPVTLRLGKASVTVRGRVLSLEGKPIQKAVIRVLRVEAPDGKNGLKEMYDKWAASPNEAASLLQKRLLFPAAGGLPEKVTANAEGRFEIRGAGDGRVLSLEFSADTIETVIARVAVDPAFDAKAVRFDPNKADPRSPYQRTGPPLYGPTFDHTARPCRVIRGTVFDQKTKRPLPNVAVSGRLVGGWWELGVYTRTDEAGRFWLTGLPNAECVLVFGSSKPTRYLMLEKTVHATEGLAPATMEMPLVQGTVVTGKVTDKTTGKPIKGGIRYSTLSGNKHLRDLPGKDIHGLGTMTYHLDAEGRFRFVAPPGLGIIVVQAASFDGTERPYTKARIRASDRGKPYFRSTAGLGENFITSAGAFHSFSGNHAYRVIEPDVGAETLTADLQLDPGKSVTGKVVGPDGLPFSGTTIIAGLSGTFERPAPLKGHTFTARALNEDEVRSVAAVCPGKKLAGTAVIRGNEKEPPVLRLTAWGAVTGRVVDADGTPIVGATVRLYFKDRAAQELYRHLTDDKPATTDAAGRFRADIPFAGSEFSFMLSHKGKFLNRAKTPMVVAVKAGETKKLEDIVATSDE